MAKKVDAAQPVEALGVVLPVEAWQAIDVGEQQLQHALRVLGAAEKCGVECDKFRKLARELATGFNVFRKTWLRPGDDGSGD